ncbi:MaoC family dehydratase [Pseudomonas sp.]|uniref:MaoC family dehydratase n=1 Tax=Pseudomonas sp. TaxID=306 RepID=UPI002630CF23|nr:MaoC family dehydratase [Pseudomonas sp.]
MHNEIPLLGQGPFWQALDVGQRFRTFRRTVTEADLVNFIGATGQTEVIFIDADFPGAIKGGRPVPSALTYSLIEGILMQTLLQNVGLALLELHQVIKAPVLVNDSVYAVVEITDIRPTSKSGRAVVTQQVTVFNQNAVTVMEYSVKRLLAGQPA